MFIVSVSIHTLYILCIYTKLSLCTCGKVDCARASYGTMYYSMTARRRSRYIGFFSDLFSSFAAAYILYAHMREYVCSSDFWLHVSCT